MRNTILVGDVLDRLKDIPAGSVHMVVTSPPYWGLRDYGTATWEGGDDAACEHKPTAVANRKEDFKQRGEARGYDPGSNFANYGERYATASDFTHVCGKCGARRIDAQLGLEATPDEYIAQMVAVFREVWRVMRDDGTLWLNMGDTFAHAGACGGASPLENPTDGRVGDQSPRGRTTDAEKQKAMSYRVPPGLKPKDLCGMPWRLAFALQGFAVVPFGRFSEWADILREAQERQDWELVKLCEVRLRHEDLLTRLHYEAGWLRQDIIWAKPNPMPESCTDRCTKAHEYIFLLAKRAKYYYDAEAVREEELSPGRSAKEIERQVKLRADETNRGRKPALVADSVGGWKGDGTTYRGGRNRRSVWTVAPTVVQQFLEWKRARAAEAAEPADKKDVWTVATHPYSKAHFATFPPKLIEPCILAGTSEKGCCPACGAPWRRVVERSGRAPVRSGVKTTNPDRTDNDRPSGPEHNAWKAAHPDTTTGWLPTCECYPIPRTADLRKRGQQNRQREWEPRAARWAAKQGFATVRGIVLDPFIGAGTTGLVAQRLGRDWIGVELSPEYAAMALERIRGDAPLFTKARISPGRKG